MPDPAIYVIDDDEAARDGLVFLLTSSNFLVPGQASQPRTGRRPHGSGCPQPLDHDRRRTSACRKSYAAIGRKNAMERVASFLLEMDRRLAAAGMIELPMCRRDIGDYLGLSLMGTQVPS